MGTDRSRHGPQLEPFRYPRTEQRQARVRRVLEQRQPGLTVVLEDVHDPHNVSAVLRSCDATGVLDVHLIYVHETPPARAFHRTTSASAAKWIRTHFYDGVEPCFGALRAEGKRIWATSLGETTTDLYDLDLAQPTALVFGNEHRGVSQRALELADGAVAIPMHGMVESLNISVACAVSLFEAMRQRREAGLYEAPQLSTSDLDAIEVDWLRK
jgi:tRNA (guanosine-2'-O-)-methyltransferase